MNEVTVSNPVTMQQAVMVRQTASGFEQGIAATAGFFTAGPIGALASWGAIRGLQGKWAPWFVLGIPAVVGINIANLVALGIIGAAFAPEEGNYTPNNSREVLTSLPSYNQPLAGGETTLQEKCEVLLESHNSNNRVGIFETTYAIQTEHDAPHRMTSYEVCDTVGSWAWDSSESGTSPLDNKAVR